MEVINNGAREHTKVIHHDNLDFLINSNYGNSEIASLALELSMNGIVETWVPYIRREFDIEDPRNRKFGGIGTFVDSWPEPIFMAKFKYNTHWIYKSRKGSLIPDKSELVTAMKKRKSYAMASILSEFSLTPTIRAVIKSGAAKKVANFFGFSDLHYPEPILGIIDHENGNKSLIYDYVDADDWHNTKPGRKNRIQELNKLSYSNPRNLSYLPDRLEKLFKKSGVFPGDIGEVQLMSREELDGSHTLYLIDAEAYFKDPKRKFGELSAGGANL